jgi:hypothetical protein
MILNDRSKYPVSARSACRGGNALGMIPPLFKVASTDLLLAWGSQALSHRSASCQGPFALPQRRFRRTRKPILDELAFYRQSTP